MMSPQEVDQGHPVGKKVVPIHVTVLWKENDKAVLNLHHLDEKDIPLGTDLYHHVEDQTGNQAQGIKIGLEKEALDLELQESLQEILIKSLKNLNVIHPDHGQDHQDVRNISEVDQVQDQVLTITVIPNENLKLRNRKSIHPNHRQVTVQTVTINQSDF